MASEVRCGCGKLVYVDPSLAGQNVQCPHCQGVVAVPVATASSAPPDPAKQKQAEAVGMVVGGAVALVVVWLASDLIPVGLGRLVALAGVGGIGFGLMKLSGQD